MRSNDCKNITADPATTKTKRELRGRKTVCRLVQKLEYSRTSFLRSLLWAVAILLCKNILRHVPQGLQFSGRPRISRRMGGANLIFTVRNSSCGKVMFLQACVKNFVPSRCTLPLADTPSLGRHPLLGKHPLPSADSPPPPKMATAADDTHSTGMHYCRPNISRKLHEN